MMHLNGNLLAVIDVETTGVRPRHNDILEVAVIILDHQIKPDPNIAPFTMHLKPMRPENIDLEALRVQRKNLDDVIKRGVVNKKSLVTAAQLKGIDPFRAADLFFEWFEDLELPPNKRLMPIAHNWCFDREFIIDWLGPATFELIFDPRYRDTMCMSLFENDIADYRRENFPYQKNNLQYLCSTLKVPTPNAHTALDDAVATAEVFRLMVKRSFLRGDLNVSKASSQKS